MENQVNTRVLLLRTELGMGNNEFCLKANISTSTLWSIQNGTEMKPRTIKSICEAFNVNREWLTTGTGKMFNTTPAVAKTDLSWREEAYSLMKQQLEQQNETITKLMGIVSKLNFLKTLTKEDSKVIEMFTNESLKASA